MHLAILGDILDKLVITFAVALNEEESILALFTFNSVACCSSAFCACRWTGCKKYKMLLCGPVQSLYKSQLCGYGEYYVFTLLLTFASAVLCKVFCRVTDTMTLPVCQVPGTLSCFRGGIFEFQTC